MPTYLWMLGIGLGTLGWLLFNLSLQRSARECPEMHLVLAALEEEAWLSRDELKQRSPHAARLLPIFGRAYKLGYLEGRLLGDAELEAAIASQHRKTRWPDGSFDEVKAMLQRAGFNTNTLPGSLWFYEIRRTPKGTKQLAQ